MSRDFLSLSITLTYGQAHRQLAEDRKAIFKLVELEIPCKLNRQSFIVVRVIQKQFSMFIVTSNELTNDSQ